MKQKVSVIISSLLKDISSLDEALRSINASNPHEIILVVPKSKNAPKWLAKKYKFKIVKQKGNTLADARNEGVKNATGDIVAFTDDDCIVPRDWINKIQDGFERYDAAGVGGPSLPAIKGGIFGDIGGYWRHIKKERYVKWFGGRNMAFKKDALLEVGLFDPNLITNEDVEIGCKLTRKGYKLIFLPSLVVKHKERQTLKSLIKQKFRYGIGKAQLLKKIKEISPCKRVFFSPIATLFMFFLIGYSIIDKVFSILFIAYFFAFLYMSLRPYSFPKRKIFIAVFFVLVTMISQTIGFIAGMVGVR